MRDSYSFLATAKSWWFFPGSSYLPMVLWKEGKTCRLKGLGPTSWNAWIGGHTKGLANWWPGFKSLVSIHVKKKTKSYERFHSFHGSTLLMKIDGSIHLAFTKSSPNAQTKLATSWSDSLRWQRETWKTNVSWSSYTVHIVVIKPTQNWYVLNPQDISVFLRSYESEFDAVRSIFIHKKLNSKMITKFYTYILYMYIL